jgi:hypothetical protein
VLHQRRVQAFLSNAVTPGGTNEVNLVSMSLDLAMRELAGVTSISPV